MTDRQADMLFYNGWVYTVDEQNPQAEALAIKDGRLLAVGSRQELQVYCGASTMQVDLQGRTVLPGLMDSHLHPPGLFLQNLYEVQLIGIHGTEAWVAAVDSFLRTHPGIHAIYGRGWSWADLTGEEAVKGPRREYLDQVSRDIPIILRSSDGHTLWANTAALEQAEIQIDSPIPAGGVLEIDEQTGALWGTLKEGAMGLLPLAEYSVEQYEQALREFQEYMHSLGITGILSLASLYFPKLMDAFVRLDQAGELKMHVNCAFAIQPTESLEVQLAQLAKVQKKYQSSQIHMTTAKFFADGVIEGKTAALYTPYQPAAGRGEDYYGTLLWETRTLTQAFIACSRMGLQIHVHSIGDRATGQVLDALEQAAKEVKLQRPVITHLQLVSPVDMDRFARLGVIASVQPYWHYKGAGWWDLVDRTYIGQAAELEFPLAGFVKRGVVLASSSDYPATIEPNPFIAMQIGVTRDVCYSADEPNADVNQGAQVLNAKEAVRVEDMVRSFSYSNAWSLFLEKKTGSLTAGRQADFIVLAEPLFSLPPQQIGKIQVAMTFFEGQCVYGQELLAKLSGTHARLVENQPEQERK